MRKRPTLIVAFYSEGSRTGKDTAATYYRKAVERAGFTVSQSGFADEAKLVCADALGIGGTRQSRIAEVDRIKVSGHVWFSYRASDAVALSPLRISGRDFIIGLCGDTSGKHGIRRLDQEFWIRHAFEAIPEDSDMHLFTDLRFHPEATAVHKRGGIILEVRRGAGELHNEDRIEANWVVENNGTLIELREQIEQIAALGIATLRN